MAPNSGDFFSFRYAVQVFATAEKELIADDGRGSIDWVVEDIRRNEFQLIGVIDHDGGPVAADEIDMAAGGDRRGIHTSQVFDSLGAVMRLAGVDVEAS